MELKINEYQLPAQILFNYEELKAELTEKVSVYSNMVYTDDQIQLAKKDKANLNKLKNALNDERIRREKEYMIPFNAFKAQINEIIAIIDKPVAVIDKQVKAYEEQKRQVKLDAITLFFNEITHPEWLHFSQIFDDKWLNASVSMKAVQNAISSKLEQVEKDIATLSNLPEFGFEATEVYKSSLEINKALNEGHRLSEIQKAKLEAETRQKAIAEEQAKRQAEIEKIRQAEFEEKMNAPVEDIPGQITFTNSETFDVIVEEQKKQWIAFKALLTTEDALALKAFFESRHIEFKAV